MSLTRLIEKMIQQALQRRVILFGHVCVSHCGGLDRADSIHSSCVIEASCIGSASVSMHPLYYSESQLQKVQHGVRLWEICCLSARSWCENVFDRKHAVVIVPCDLCWCANTRGHIQLADSCLPSPHKYRTIHIHEHANTGHMFGCEWLTRQENINVHQCHLVVGQCAFSLFVLSPR